MSVHEKLAALATAFVSVATISCRDQSPDTPDTTAPAIEAVSPQANAADVSVATTVTITFSESIELADTAHAIVLQQKGASVAGSSAVLAERTIRFTPTDILDPGIPYTVQIQAGISDKSGNTLEQAPPSWSFTTTGRTATAPPTPTIMKELARLADDSMLGRGSGTADELRAARYIREQFQTAGLQAPAGGYLQTFAATKFRLSGNIEATSQNVIGIVPGSGSLRAEWLVIGAHYDHVGMQTGAGVTDIYNGADDNGSGTAALIALAANVAAHVAAGGTGGDARRSIMFIAFGAEEWGLLGSEYYCAHAATPLASVTAMINFDMIGRMENDVLYVGGVGTATEWPALLNRYNTTPLQIRETDCTGCTDFACFRRNERPVLWLFTGMHADYHAPTDDVQLINQAGLQRIADLALRTILNLAVRPGPLHKPASQ